MQPPQPSATTASTAEIVDYLNMFIQAEASPSTEVPSVAQPAHAQPAVPPNVPQTHTSPQSNVRGGQSDSKMTPQPAVPSELPLATAPLRSASAMPMAERGTSAMPLSAVDEQHSKMEEIVSDSLQVFTVCVNSVLPKGTGLHSLGLLNNSSAGGQPCSIF